MASLFRRSVLIVAAMVGSAALLSAIIVFAVSLTAYGIRPAELLPGKFVVAIMENDNSELTTVWNRFIMPSKSRPGMTVAIVDAGSGSVGTIAFERKASGEEGEDTIGAYALSFSDPALRGMVGKHKQSIAESPVYRALRAGKQTDASWIFLARTDRVRPSTLLDRILVALTLRDSKGIGIAKSESGWTVNSFTDVPDPSHSDAPELPHLPNTILALSASAPARMWKDFIANADQETAVVTEGALRARIRATFGDGISPEYELLPLLNGPSAFALSQSGAHLTFVLRGSAQSPAALGNILSRMHDSFAASFPATRVTTRTLDKQFSSTIVRDDSTVLREAEETINGWIVRETAQTNGDKRLFSATQGSRFILSNDKDTLLSAMSGTENVPEELGPGSVVVTARGVMDIAALGPQLSPFLPGITLTALPLSGNVSWSAERSGNILTIGIATDAREGASSIFPGKNR